MHAERAVAYRARRRIGGDAGIPVDGRRLRRALGLGGRAVAENPPRELPDVDRLLDVAGKAAHGQPFATAVGE